MPGTSSGSTSIGVWQFLMKSRRHAVQEVGLNRIQVVQVFLDRICRHVGPPRQEGGPVLLAVPVQDRGVFRPMAEDGGNDVNDIAPGVLYGPACRSKLMSRS